MHFKVVKYLGEGNFVDVFQVMPTGNAECTGESYALKRYDLRSRLAAQCALKEHAILKIIATERSHTCFLTNLHYSTFQNGSPMLFLTMGSGYDLSDLIGCYQSGYLQFRCHNVRINTGICTRIRRGN